MLTFVHLSDIHFGQEIGGRRITHQDVRERLVEHVQQFFNAAKATGHRAGAAAGLIVTGDIAYAGAADEYRDAGLWLDRVATASGCDPAKHVQVVPGNHDVDLQLLSPGGVRMIAAVREHGERELDQYLANKDDREQLYRRLTQYRTFAAGYGCFLDEEGGGAGDRVVDLAPGRQLHFLGLNSTLLCKGKDALGELMLGARQRTIPRDPGVERVILCHHPLEYFADGKDATAFVRTRGRVYMSGHEHRADLVKEEVEQDGDLLRVESGAAVPPDGSGEFAYTFNFIDFELSTDGHQLSATVHPRVWSHRSKSFEPDYNRSGGESSRTFWLRCPRFREALPATNAAPARVDPSETPNPFEGGTAVQNDLAKGSIPDDDFPQVRLLFFRHLDRLRRLSILVSLGALPQGLADVPTMGVERQALERVRAEGKLKELRAAVAKEIAGSGPKEARS